MRLELEVEFDIADLVYLKAAISDNDNHKKGQVVGYKVYPGSVQYIVDWADDTSGTYFGFQLTTNQFGDNAELN